MNLECFTLVMMQLSGYDHDRSRLRGQGGNEGATRNSIKLSTVGINDEFIHGFYLFRVLKLFYFSAYAKNWWTPELLRGTSSHTGSSSRAWPRRRSTRRLHGFRTVYRCKAFFVFECVAVRFFALFLKNV